VNTGFNLRATARDMIRTQGGVNSTQALRKAAAELIARIPPEHRVESDLQAYAILVAKVADHMRAHLRPAPFPPEPAPSSSEPEASRGKGRRRGKSANSANSPTAAAMRLIGHYLRDTEYRVVPDAALGDYTPENAEAVADYLDTVAARNARRASAYRDLAKHMRAAGVGRVRDLPPDVLAAILLPAAKEAA
jgi:hypothetical protein